jgi:hypothetical protein
VVATADQAAPEAQAELVPPAELETSPAPEPAAGTTLDRGQLRHQLGRHVLGSRRSSALVHEGYLMQAVGEAPKPEDGG